MKSKISGNVIEKYAILKKETWETVYDLIQLNGVVSMCDVEKYKKIYQEIAQLDPEDTLQLILEADTKEQREFYQVVGDFLLQKKQKEVIERNLF